jgi:hypothetical protein
MGLSRKSREEILEDQHNRWLLEVADSGLPEHLVDVYGAPHINTTDDDGEPDEFTFWDGDDSASE